MRKRAGLARAMEVRVPLPAAAAMPDYPRIYYGHIARGYAWSFPGPDYRLLGIAAGGPDREDYRRHLVEKYGT